MLEMLLLFSVDENFAKSGGLLTTVTNGVAEMRATWYRERNRNYLRDNRLVIERVVY